MSVKPQFETYRYVGELCRLRGQSIVECRLPGSEISSILAVNATAVAQDSACQDGEVRYGGKVLLNIVYEDGDKRVCRAERGAEFFHKAEGKAVSPACFAKTALSCANVTWRREGSGLYVSVVVDADIGVYGNKQIEYLSGGEGLLVQPQALAVYKTVCVSGETEGEDEFDSDYVGDILLHSERAVAHRVSANAGLLEIDGEISVNICVLKSDDSVCSYERITPFSMQIPCEDAFGHVTADAKVCVKSAHITAGTDEEKGKSRIVLSYVLAADCRVYVKEELSAVADAFSTRTEISLKKQNDGGRYLTSSVKYTERVSGVAALNAPEEGEYVLQAAVLPRAEITCRKTERGVDAEGAVLADVILVGADGSHRLANLTLPFVFPLDVDGAEVEADCAVCSLHIRRKKNGETEAEATLKLCARVYERATWEYVCELTEGAEIPSETSAFSVFLPKEGEDLWQVAKRLNCSPEELQKSNPQLEFPLKAGERIFVYRQIV